MSQDEILDDAPEPLSVQLRRSNRERQSSTMYTFDEYVTLIDGEEPECYQEAMKSKETQKGIDKLKKQLSESFAMKDMGGREHWNAVKWILRYLHGSSDLRLCFGGDKPTFVGYSDSDMAGDIDLRKSALGYLIKFAGGASAIHLGKNLTFHSMSKHIDVRYHWIHDALDAKLLELAKVYTDDNDADMMTKVLSRGKFESCCEIARLTITSTGDMCVTFGLQTMWTKAKYPQAH
ncbi:hypothetical protein CR513_48417, partial [Mucuna pruriens]